MQQVRYLINRQRYLELLEQGRISNALTVLRHDIVPLDIPSNQVQDLSRYGYQWLFSDLNSDLSQFTYVYRRRRVAQPSVLGRCLWYISKNASITAAVLHSLFYHDPTPSDGRAPVTSTDISTTTMYIPQCLYTSQLCRRKG